MDCKLPDSSVHGILQTRILEWLPSPPLGDIPHPGLEPACHLSPALHTNSLLTESPGKPFISQYTLFGASLVAQVVKNLPAKQEAQVQSLGQEDPLEKRMATTPVFLPREFHGQRILVGYSPWGHRELDMTGQLAHILILNRVDNTKGKIHDIHTIEPDV